MKHASLFTGIGGFDLAAERVGFENIFQVEIDKFCQKVLEKNFPKVKRFLDIKDFNGKEYRERIDILSGGFPCQPFSQAGQRKGNQDERALFPEMLRIIGEVKPKWIVAENVSGILSIHDGEYFEEICTSLESEGYKVQSFIIPASAVNAPHRRDRLWIIAYSDSIRRNNEQKEKRQTIQNKIGQLQIEEQKGKFEQRRIKQYDPDVSYSNGEWELQQKRIDKNEREWIVNNDRLNPDNNQLNGNDAGFCTSKISQFKETEIQGCDSSHSECERLQGSSRIKEKKLCGQREVRRINRSWDESWIEVATRLCRMDARISGRVDRLKSLGNSIVPQIAEIIFETIKEVEEKFK